MVETPLARLVLARHARFAMRSMMPGRSCRRLKPGLSRLSRHGKVLPPSPPAEKSTASEDQTGQGLPSIRLLLAQYPFNSLHNWHFEILFIVAIIIQLIHIVLEAL